jgi:hypothetical protein
MRSKQNDSPHTPEFSTTRSFPGVGGVEALPETALAGIKPPLTSAGRANIVTSAERKNIASEEQRHQVYVL